MQTCVKKKKKKLLKSKNTWFLPLTIYFVFDFLLFLLCIMIYENEGNK